MKAEIKLTRKSLGNNWTGYKTNTGVLNELKITSVMEKNKIIQIELERIPCDRLSQISNINIITHKDVMKNKTVNMHGEVIKRD